jgi:UDP-GlcNAc:undecaprenyl-phosphate GlcNAc-1-phosphate transferase
MFVSLFLKPGLLAFFTSLVLTPLVIWLFEKQGWVEDPEEDEKFNTTHQQPIPRGGGVSIFLAIFLTVIIFLQPDPQLKAVFGAGLITLLAGFLDDIFDLSPYLRLITNAVAAIIIIYSGIKIKFITNPINGIMHLDQSFLFLSLADVVTFLWLIWCMNVVGWSAGIAGQLPGFVSITTLVIGILSLRFVNDLTQWPVTVLAASTAGAYLGFLPYNFYPQKMMPGYSGKSLAGFLIGVLAILSGAKLATVILTLALPMVDGLWAVSRRIIQGQSPVWGDAKHLHHLLLKIGLPKPLIAITYWLFSALLGFLVLQLSSTQKVWAIIMISMAISFLLLMLHQLIKNKKN